MTGSSHEEHMLEEMCHPSLTVSLVPRPDHIRHVDCDLRPTAVGKEQHPKAIIKLVLGDAFNGGDWFKVEAGLLVCG